MFFSVYWAFQNENRLNEFESILIQILKDLDQRKPEYVLIATNLGVLQIEIGNLEIAKQTFDSIFPWIGVILIIQKNLNLWIRF